MHKFRVRTSVLSAESWLMTGAAGGRAARGLALALGLALITMSGAEAQEPRRLGDFGDWSAFKSEEASGPVCYMASQPKKDEGDYERRGEIYALVTHRPQEDRRDEVSFVAGYQYKENSWVDVTIGNEKAKFFTQGDGAWAADSETDKRMVEAMIKGRTMIVEGTSSRGTLTKDTYSLIGFTKAYEAISEACGVAS